MGIRALVIDDSKVERNYLAGLLDRLGVETDTAESCSEGVNQCTEKLYDILFIDYFMPDADGVHALKEIRSSEEGMNTATPAVAVGTADSVLGDDFFLMQGFLNYLEKPVRFDMLHASLLLYLPEEKRREIQVGTVVREAEQSSVPPEALIPDWLESVEELNTKEGVKNCGTEDGYMSALTIFYNSIDKMSDEIQGYYTSGNWTDYTIKVHALKSSARIIGLAELSELARQLEAAGDAKELDFIHDNTDRLLSWYRSYKQKLSRLSDGAENEAEDERPLAEPDFLEDAFSSLEEFAGQMDYDLVEMVINSVGEYRLAPEDKEIYDAVNDAFMSLDWNGIKSAAHRYIERVYGSDDSG